MAALTEVERLAVLAAIHHAEVRARRSRDRLLRRYPTSTATDQLEERITLLASAKSKLSHPSTPTITNYCADCGGSGHGCCQATVMY
jgi:hypothetical protein